jgi:glycogen(starch) synthase
MRIVHLTWEYPPLVYGGMAPHVANLAQAQVAAGHRVIVITQAHPQAPADAVVGGVRVLRVPHDPPMLELNHANLLAWVASLNNAMGTALVAHAPGAEVLHAHDWVTAYASAVGARALGLPLVATFHSTERGRHQGHLPTALAQSVDEVERWLASLSRRAIVCSQEMVHEVDDSLGILPHVIPNGVDRAAWHVEPSPQPEAGRSRPLVFGGRLEWEKGVFDLIDALPAVRRRIPGTRLVMAGRGTQEEAIRERIAHRKLGGVIDLVGHQTQPQLAALFAGAAAVVVPSRYEPFGMVALEAAAAGAPLVLADTGGLAEIGQHGAAAAMFPPGHISGLVDALTETLADPVAAGARSRVAQTSLEQRFRWDLIAADTVAVYQQAIA